MNLFNNEEIRYLGWKQPFASLMLYGKIETRTWDTKYRGLVLITASKAPYHMEQYADIAGDSYQHIWDTLGNPETVICGHAIAVGRLVDSKPMTKEDEGKCFVEYREPWIEERVSKKTGIKKKVLVKLWCHVYEDVQAIEPFEIKGAQGWRKLNQETIIKIKYL